MLLLPAYLDSIVLPAPDQATISVAVDGHGKSTHTLWQIYCDRISAESRCDIMMLPMIQIASTPSGDFDPMNVIRIW